MGISYKGAISFGLIYIPITLHNVIRTNDISFNMIDKNTMSRVKYKKTCVDCNDREVKQSEIVKGYEYEEGKYVIFENDDFEKIKSKKDKNIIIERFVNLSDIDPIYYDKAYYVAPDKGAAKAFNLLLQAMEKENKVGISKTVLGTKEKLVAIRVKNKIMYLNTMFFNDEVQYAPYMSETTNLVKQELDLAINLLNTMTKKFQPKDYVDEYKIKIEEAIEAKIAGKQIIRKEEIEGNQALDLMIALQESLKNFGVDARS
ncbi:MAG: Ku protein [Bacilli bacterium]|nr:Ku protein [Bacilli bacterium]